MKKWIGIICGFMLLITTSLCTSAAEDTVTPKLIVQGEGKVSAAPDIVTIQLGVETRNASASIAAQENARLMNSTIKALLDSGIDKKEIQTSHYSLTTEPQVEPKEGEKPQPPEFIATNQVTVKLNNTEDAGKVLDAAVSSGSNSIQGVSFDLKNPEPMKDKALTLAIKDAAQKAKVAATAAGVKLGKVLEISEGYGFIGAAAPKGVMYADGAITPIQPGEVEVKASVTTTYAIS
ncbi:MAG: SIMPL domain-containing protein [Methanotrichaceae archaeon]|nr:SIMPL domain-containing protein [Methanotrichaceae archaeon]MDD1758876.1 SIMPL domain-containing protein [Methanotrichaceae archaeon]